MNPPIGFVITSYHKPHQLERLTRRLNQLFGEPPTVCHHNFDQCALDTERFPKNVSFIRPHLKTGWGDFNLLEAVLRAMDQLFSAPNAPDWFVLLSGSDYPIKPAAKILENLQTGGFDAHVIITKLDGAPTSSHWKKMAMRRYRAKHFKIPFLKKGISVPENFLTRSWFPFRGGLECYAGMFWFSANRATARRMIAVHRANPKLAAHYRRVIIPEESYFHTLMGNLPGIKINSNSWLYSDWSKGSAHPRPLGAADFDKIIASPANFARKFDMDADAAILDKLDEAVR